MWKLTIKCLTFNIIKKLPFTMFMKELKCNILRMKVNVVLGNF